MAVYKSQHARRPDPLKAMIFGFVVIVTGALCGLAGFYEATLG